MGGINAALEAFKWFDNDPEKIKDYLTDLKNKKAKWITDVTKKPSNQMIETATIVTNVYYVTIKDGKYIIENNPEMTDGLTHVDYNFFNNKTNTNHVITFFGDKSVFEITDCDDNFLINIFNLLNMKWDELDQVGDTMHFMLTYGGF